jgi:hypothetical protein
LRKAAVWQQVRQPNWLTGGFKTIKGTTKSGQVHINYQVGRWKHFALSRKADLLKQQNKTHASMKSRGGGLLEIPLADKTGALVRPPWLPVCRGSCRNDAGATGNAIPRESAQFLLSFYCCAVAAMSSLKIQRSVMR